MFSKKKIFPNDIITLSEENDESIISINKEKDKSIFSDLNKSSEIESTKDENNESISILVNNGNKLNEHGKSENEEEKEDKNKENEHERNIEDDNKGKEYEKNGENKNIKMNLEVKKMKKIKKKKIK